MGYGKRRVSILWDNSQYRRAVAGGSNIVDCRFLIADWLYLIGSIGNWQSTIGNDCAPTRYRAVVLTVCHKIENGSRSCLCAALLMQDGADLAFGLLDV
jgi:hypothetical protein